MRPQLTTPPTSPARLRLLWSSLFLLSLLSLSARAGVTINSSLTITHIVTVQPIRVTTTNGSAAATTFGNSGSETHIKETIDLILSQSGLNVSWLPVVDYASTFAFDNAPANYSSNPRPQSHLNSIVTGAGSPPKSPDPTVVNLFFVDVVPGFPQLSNNHVAGIATVDGNGIAAYVGPNLLGWSGGQEIIAKVLAHEIGHNLGLDHVGASADNLMATYSAQSEKLTATQTGIIFTNNGGIDGYDFLGLYSPPTNYSIWADGYGLTDTPDADHDRDQLANVLEFMLGLDPTPPDNHAMPTPVWDPSGLTWTMPKNSDALDDGLIYAIEVSTDGSSWTPAGTGGSGSTVLLDNASTFSVRLDSGSAVNLMRLTVDLSVPLLPGSGHLIPPASEPPLPASLPGISGCSPTTCGCRHLIR